MHKCFVTKLQVDGPWSRTFAYQIAREKLIDLEITSERPSPGIFVVAVHTVGGRPLTLDVCYVQQHQQTYRVAFIRPTGVNRNASHLCFGFTKQGFTYKHNLNQAARVSMAFSAVLRFKLTRDYSVLSWTALTAQRISGRHGISQ